MTTITCRRSILKILQLFAVSFFLMVPFIRTSNGYGLIRFDAERLRLYFFNNIITFDNFFTASLVILLFVFIFIIVTQIFGRFWCGWLCPQSFFSKLAVNLSGRLPRKYAKAAAVFTAFLSAAALSLNWIWYFIPPSEFIHTVSNGFVSITVTVWLVLFIALFMDFAFVGFKWCRYLCPYAKMQTLMSDGDTLYIGLLNAKKDGCINCGACIKKCPVKIDPRKTPDNACVYCETCMTVCGKILSKRGGSVLGYNWGGTGRFTFRRTNLLITIFIAVLLSGLLIYDIFENKPFSVKCERVVKDAGETYNVDLKLKNGSSKNTIITFFAEDGIAVEPRTVSLKAKEKKQIKMTVSTGEDIKNIKIKASAGGGFENMITFEKAGK